MASDFGPQKEPASIARLRAQQRSLEASHGLRLREAQPEKQFMSDTQQQYGKRWEDLPADEQRKGYWLAVPEPGQNCWGGMEYEVVYVSASCERMALWSVGGEEGEDLDCWRFLRRLDLPASAAEVMAQADQDRNRKAVDAAVDRAGREIADESFVFPTGGDIS